MAGFCACINSAMCNTQSKKPSSDSPSYFPTPCSPTNWCRLPSLLLRSLFNSNRSSCADMTSISKPLSLRASSRIFPPFMPPVTDPFSFVGGFGLLEEVFNLGGHAQCAVKRSSQSFSSRDTGRALGCRTAEGSSTSCGRKSGNALLSMFLVKFLMWLAVVKQDATPESSIPCV